MEPLLSKLEVSSDGQGHHVYNNSHLRLRPTTGFDDMSPLDPSQSSTHQALRKLNDNLLFIRERMEAEEEDKVRELEWEMLTAVLDRFFLILFQVGIVLVTGAFVGLGMITEQSHYVRNRENLV